MFAVIFRATIKEFDDEYSTLGAELRQLAFDKYGCLDFVSVLEGNEEIAISYWDNEQQIIDWKNDPMHLLAQKAGASRIYESYSVDICEVKNAYKRP